MFKNELGQPVGFPVKQVQAARPSGTALRGRYCQVERLDPDTHAPDLHSAYSLDTDHSGWTYLPYGPFNTVVEYQQWMREYCLGDDPLFYAIVDKDSNRAIGVASYLRITPIDGVIEVGHINYSPLLQRTVMASEAMYLMMQHVFEDLNYRRYEWKCDALNAPSRKAALRFGFTFEGIFRQATVYKGRNRNTAWFSVIDSEWPSIKKAHQQWLAPENFVNDQQLQSLSSIMLTVKRNET